MIKSMQQWFYARTFQRYEIVAPNIYLDHNSSEMDLIGVRKSGFCDEIEIKTRRSDFLADFKKTVRVPVDYIGGSNVATRHVRYRGMPKHDALRQGLLHCNYFSFLLTEDLVEKCTIPEYAGLYIYRDTRWGLRVVEERTAPRLHNRKISDKLKYQIGRKMAYRYWQRGQNDDVV